MKHIEPLYGCNHDQTLDIMLLWVENKLEAINKYKAHSNIISTVMANNLLTTYYLTHFK